MDHAASTWIAPVLRPVAPPRVVEGVYTDDQHARILQVVKAHGPWPTITAHHFDTIEELVATSTGVVPDGLSLTLDDVATAHFRGFFGENSVLYYPTLFDCFYNERFLEWVRDYWGVRYAKPQMMLCNLCGPHRSGTNAHLDAVHFRGLGFENTPTWLLNTMGKSGLFEEYRLKKAQVITWWYLGEHGTFTYWPDGPDGPPQVLGHPMWNRGVVVENERMFHRGDPVGRPDERDVPGLAHRSLLAYDASTDTWRITTDGAVIRTYRPEEMRLLVHWSAEVYTDLDEVKKVADHTDDLTLEMAIDRLLADMRARGTRVDEPSDPLHDTEFIRAAIATYTVAPTTDWLDEASG
jgi:hypothetical protein